MVLSAADGKALPVDRRHGRWAFRPSAIPRLFERFYQVDTSRSKQADGAGLGLALAKWIAERHGATIHVKSTPGQGSIFTLTLAQVADSPSFRQSTPDRERAINVS